MRDAIERVGAYLEGTPKADWVDSVTLEWNKGVWTLETFVFKDERSTELVEKVMSGGEGESKSVTILDLYQELKSRKISEQ